MEWRYFITKGSTGFYAKYIKRPIDFMMASLLLAIFSILFIIIILLLKFANKDAGVFFIQKRPGKQGKIFRLLKFKTMKDCKDNKGNLLPDIQRLTKIGKFIRSTSLDELPQLINVLKGDMSLVGPRPLLVDYLPLYNPQQARRHEVKPGITGWAQVNGRNQLNWTEKFKMDVWYVDNVSFILDLKILLLTLKKVFKREGINLSAHKTSERFNGKN